MAAAAAMLLVGILWQAQPAAAQKTTDVLQLGAAPLPEGTTVHVVAKMRTLPRDNFSYVNPDVDFVLVEVWKQFGGKLKWRVEKPGRVVVMDGESTVMLLRPDVAVRLPHPCNDAFNTYELLELATVRETVNNDLRSALAKQGELKITRETTPAGEKKLMVAVETKSSLPAADYLKNKFLGTSDLRRTYRFDAKTGRLEGMDAYVRRETGGETLVLSVERIEYLASADPAVFSLTLPENVQFVKDPEPLPDNQKYEQMTPKQAARAFFEACSKQDWGEAQKFYPMPLNDSMKGYLGGLEIVRLGDPFQSFISLLNGDWFVPYEIKLKDGHVKKWNLALRKHATAKRYLVDGGI
jgi:outer membrane lipoprotein-sorting protein